MATRVLVTGATGFLGPWVVKALQQRAAVVTLARKDADLCVDLQDLDAVRAAIAAVRPDRVLNLAALSRMALCERDPQQARAVNALAPEALAAELGSRLLHVSTDLVFDGRSAPYAPLDPVGPLSAYGQTKAEGEELVRARGGCVVRVPLLFGPDANGRGGTGMIRSGLAAGTPLGLFTNEYRTPLHARDAAEGLAALVLQPAMPRLAHLTGPERVSRWEFGQRFCRIHGLPTALLRAVECQDALRPRDVSLAGLLPTRDLAAMLADS